MHRYTFLPVSRHGRFAVTMSLALMAGGVSPAEGSTPQEYVLHVDFSYFSSFKVKLPRDFDGAKEYPLVIGMHGRGGTAKSFLEMWNAWQNPGFVFAVPEAPYPLGSGFSWDYPTEDRTLWQSADPLICANILKAIGLVRTRIKVGAVYLLAHSQGVAYAYMTALRHPGLVRGLVCFAGIFPDKFMAGTDWKAAAKGLRVFLAHGEQDKALPISVSRRAKGLLESCGSTVVLREFPGGHEIPVGMLQEAQAWIEGRP